jgi:hypothetical protein
MTDRKHFGRKKLNIGYFRPIPTKKFSADLSRLALGLKGLTTLNDSLNSLTNWL